MSDQYDPIRPFHDSEVNDAILSIMHHPMMKPIMEFTFPQKEESVWQEELRQIKSTYDFQSRVVAKSLEMILKKSSEGLTFSGFDALDKNSSYLYISNHRDIILDTSLLNLILHDNSLVMTASAIGDNLLKNPFLHTLSKINRNFIVRRGLPPRELLQSSKLLSEYIHQLVTAQNRSVWIAQREGRTKDGNDATHQGVLKMLSMAASKDEMPAEYFKKMRLVAVAISYEYDPTDALKLPELLANLNNEVYVKGENEDFNTLIKGLIGQKKHIHYHASKISDMELDIIAEMPNANQQIKAIAQLIDEHIISQYKLWPSNYIAYDYLHKTDKFVNQYSQTDKDQFLHRFESKIDTSDPQTVESFLEMYANPVVNRLKLAESHPPQYSDFGFQISGVGA